MTNQACPTSKRCCPKTHTVKKTSFLMCRSTSTIMQWSQMLSPSQLWECALSRTPHVNRTTAAHLALTNSSSTLVWQIKCLQASSNLPRKISILLSFKITKTIINRRCKLLGLLLIWRVQNRGREALPLSNQHMAVLIHIMWSKRVQDLFQSCPIISWLIISPACPVLAVVSAAKAPV